MQPNRDALAHSLDCLTDDDICALCNITPVTLENWRKRGKGPVYSLVGNTRLYPRDKFREFVGRQLRERETVGPKHVL